MLILHENICCGPSSEPSRQDSSDEGSHHMVSMKNKKNYPSIIIKYSSCLELSNQPAHLCKNISLIHSLNRHKQDWYDQAENFQFTHGLLAVFVHHPPFDNNLCLRNTFWPLNEVLIWVTRYIISNYVIIILKYWSFLEYL